MRILIVGAGVVGSNLAHSMKKASNEITILARGKTYENLKNNGLVIKHKFGRKTVDHFRVIDKLEMNDIYNVIIVVSRFSSLDDIIPMIENNRSQFILFVGNNICAEKYVHLRNKSVMFGFFSAAGKKHDGYVESISLNKMVVGRTDGQNNADALINVMFRETKVKAKINNKMDDYLKSHACAVLPLVFASYKVNGDLKLLKDDKEYSLLVMDAIIDGYNVLKDLGYEILPKGEYKTCVNKKKLCAFIYRFMFSNFLGQVCISDHAMSAREEFLLLESEFENLKKKSKVETKAYDQLKRDFLDYKG